MWSPRGTTSPPPREKKLPLFSTSPIAWAMKPAYYEGAGGKGPPASEGDQEAGTMQYFFFSYDIPEWSDAVNPSGRLRRLGTRINYSDWVLAEGSVPYHLLDQLRTEGVRWHLIPF